MMIFAISLETIPIEEILLTTATLLGIVALRIIDVSAGVLRVMFIIKGRKWTAGAIGFVESLTWLIAAAAVLSSLDTPLKAIAYAGGYGAGTVIGSWLEERLAVGNVVLRVYIPHGANNPTVLLREQGYGVTETTGEGLEGAVRIILTIIPRRKLKQVMATVAQYAPKAYITANDVNTIDSTHRKWRSHRA